MANLIQTNNANIKIFGGKLSAAPVNGGGNSLLTGLQAFYKLSDLTDSSGNNLTLTNNGDVTFASGKIGNAATLDGINQTLSTTLNGGGYVSGTSVSMWMKKTGSKSTCGLIQAVDGDFSGWTVINEGDSGWFLLAGSGSGWSLQTSSFLGIDDSWHHVAIIFDPSNINIYIDGSLIAQETAVDYTTASIKIGSYDYFSGSTSQTFDGQIDAFGVWSRALSDAEVSALYNSGNGLELN